MIDQMRKEKLGKLHPQSAEVRPKSKELREALRGTGPEHMKKIRRNESIVLQENSSTLDFALGRSQDTWTGRANVSYFISQWISCNLEYLYQERDADTETLDYEDNRITFLVTATF